MSQLPILPLWGCHLPTGQGLCGLELPRSASYSECCRKDPTLCSPALVGQNVVTDEGSALGTEQWRRPTIPSNAWNVPLATCRSEVALDCLRYVPWQPYRKLDLTSPSCLHVKPQSAQCNGSKLAHAMQAIYCRPERRIVLVLT